MAGLREGPETNLLMPGRKVSHLVVRVSMVVSPLGWEGVTKGVAGRVVDRTKT